MRPKLLTVLCLAVVLGGCQRTKDVARGLLRQHDQPTVAQAASSTAPNDKTFEQRQLELQQQQLSVSKEQLEVQKQQLATEKRNADCNCGPKTVRKPAVSKTPAKKPAAVQKPAMRNAEAAPAPAPTKAEAAPEKTAEATVTLTARPLDQSVTPATQPLHRNWFQRFGHAIANDCSCLNAPPFWVDEDRAKKKNK